jgi:hypothetical protein
VLVKDGDGLCVVWMAEGPACISRHFHIQASTAWHLMTLRAGPLTMLTGVHFTHIFIYPCTVGILLANFPVNMRRDTIHT